MSNPTLGPNVPTGKYLRAGDTIAYTNSGGNAINYGDVVPLSTRIGIAGEYIAVGAVGTLIMYGEVQLPKGVSGTAFTVGEALYWDATNQCLTNSSGGNTPAGWATRPTGTTDAVAYVQIHV